MPNTTVEAVGNVLDRTENNFNNLTCLLSTKIAPDSSSRSPDVLKNDKQGLRRNTKKQSGKVLWDNESNNNLSSNIINDKEEIDITNNLMRSRWIWEMVAVNFKPYTKSGEERMEEYQDKNNW